MLYVGAGPRGSNGARFTLLWISVFHSETHNQTGSLWCWFPSKWACAHPRPLWVSPTTSSVRLGVSPAAAPTPTGAFNQRFEALFPQAGALGYVVFVPVYLCVSVGPQGLLVARLPALVVPHSASLSPPWPRESSPPRCPSPPLLLVWMNVYFLLPWCWTSLPLDFPSVLVVRGGAVCLLRRHLGSPNFFIFIKLNLTKFFMPSGFHTY